MNLFWNCIFFLFSYANYMKYLSYWNDKVDSVSGFASICDEIWCFFSFATFSLSSSPSSSLSSWSSCSHYISCRSATYHTTNKIQFNGAALMVSFIANRLVHQVYWHWYIMANDHEFAQNVIVHTEWCEREFKSTNVCMCGRVRVQAREYERERIFINIWHRSNDISLRQDDQIQINAIYVMNLHLLSQHELVYRHTKSTSGFCSFFIATPRADAYWD